MTRWEKLAVIATLLQAIVVVYSMRQIEKELDLQTGQLQVQTKQLELQTEQMQVQTKLTQAGNFQALAALSVPINLEEVKDPAVAKLLVRSAEGFKGKISNPDKLKEEQFRAWLATWLLFYENMHYQGAQGLLDKEIVKAWTEDLGDFVRDYPLEDYWPNMRASYHENFRVDIDKLVEKKESSKENPKKP